MEKKITITVDINGSATSRQFAGVGTKAWNSIVEDMIDTIEKSQVIPF